MNSFIDKKNHQDKLVNKILNSNLTSPILILGSDNIGKLSLAVTASKKLLCKDNNINCQTCKNCQLIKANNHPDLEIIVPEVSGKKIQNQKISIKEAKNIQKKVNLASHQGGFKVFIIQNANYMTHQAQNALLKILEEPSIKSKFFLTAVSEKQILPTIISRCQTFKLKPMSLTQLENKLKRISPDSDTAFISRLSQGRLDTALTFIENKKLFSDYENKVELTFKLIESDDLVYIFDKISKNIKTNQSKQFLEILTLIFRDLLFIKIESRKSQILINYDKNLKKLSQKYSKSQIINILKDISKTKKYLEQNVNPRLALENLALCLT